MADAADVLSDQLRLQLLALAELLGKQINQLHQEFRASLRNRKSGLPKLDEQQVAAVLAVTPGEAMRILAKGGTLADYFEQVAYNGRRLAKLKLPPGTVLVALEHYDRLLGKRLAKKLTDKTANPVWVREQLLFCIMLTLNNAFYIVREQETRAFYELFRAEVESRSATSLVERIARVLLEFSQADEAQLVLELPEENVTEGPGAPAELVTGKLAKASGALAIASAAERTAPLRRGKSALAQGKGPAARAKTSAKSAGWISHWIGEEASAGTGASAATREIADSPAIQKTFGQLRCLRGKAAAAALELLGGRGPASPNGLTLWVVPLHLEDRLLGFIPFTFHKDYEWLPREQELLAGAAERCSLAIEKAKLMEDLAARSKEVRDLASRMMNVEEAERRRISRELHDEAGQSLLCVRLALEMAEEKLRLKQDPVSEELATVRQTVEATIIEIRRLISALSPAVLEQLGLAAALRQLVNRFRMIYPCAVKVNLQGLEQLPRRTEMTVYRLVQECFQNIMKHSQANTVNLSVSSSDNTIKLLVEDNGVGFHLDDALAKRESYGLSGMRERVALLGGRVSVYSAPSEVTTAKTKNQNGTHAAGSATTISGSAKNPAGVGTAGLETKPETKTAAEAQRFHSARSTNGRAESDNGYSAATQKKTSRKNLTARGTRIQVELPIPREAQHQLI